MSDGSGQTAGRDVDDDDDDDDDDVRTDVIPVSNTSALSAHPYQHLENI